MLVLERHKSPANEMRESKGRMGILTDKMAQLDVPRVKHPYLVGNKFNQVILAGLLFFLIYLSQEIVN